MYFIHFSNINKLFSENRPINILELFTHFIGLHGVSRACLESVSQIIGNKPLCCVLAHVRTN
jgi:hypothetical protein